MMGIDTWFENHNDLITFARALDYDNYFESVDVIDFFEEPYKWTHEFRVWESFGKPDPSEPFGNELWTEMVVGEWAFAPTYPQPEEGEMERGDLENDDIAAGVRPA